MLRQSLYLFALLGLCSPYSAWAEGDCCGVEIKGYLEGSYNHLARSNKFISGIYDRSFDLNENGFTLQQAAVTIDYLPKQGLGGLINAVLGRDALSIAPFGYNPDIGVNNIGFVPAQVYMQYAIGAFTVIAGNFNSIVGIENADPTLNASFSLSNPATFTQPNSVLGTRLAYAVNDKINLIVGLNNGWDDIRDFSRRLTIELGLVYTNAKFNFNAELYSGEERIVNKSATGPIGTRNVLDLFGTYHVNDKLSLAFNYDYGTQQNTSTGLAIWQGIALYMDYKFNNTWRIAVRVDDFDDNDGYRTGVIQNLKEATLSLGYIPIKNLEFIAETRRDLSSAFSFIDIDTPILGKTQTSYALEAVYKFKN